MQDGFSPANILVAAMPRSVVLKQVTLYHYMLIYDILVYSIMILYYGIDGLGEPVFRVVRGPL